MAESREIQALREKVAKAQKHGLFIGVHNKGGKITFSDLVPETIEKNLDAKANWVYLLNNRLAGDRSAIDAYLSKIGIGIGADEVIITKDNLAQYVDAIKEIIAVYKDKESEYLAVANFLKSIQSKGAGLNNKVTYSNKVKAVKGNKQFDNIMMLYNNPMVGVNEKGEKTVKIYVVGAKNVLKPDVVREDAYLIPRNASGNYFPIGVANSKKDGVTTLTTVLNKIQKATGNNLSEFMNFAGRDVRTGVITGVSNVKTPVK